MQSICAFVKNVGNLEYKVSCRDLQVSTLMFLTNSSSVGRTYSNCRPISANESVRLFLATKLEIAVAQKEFGISFTTCIAFSNAAQEIARALSPPDLPIIDPSHLARSGNWALPLVTLGLQHMAKKLSEADGTDPRELYIKIRADLIRGKCSIERLEDIC